MGLKVTKEVLNLHDLIKLEQKIVPELLEVIEKRYNILRNIQYNQPIGRRILANNLGIGERIVRTEVNFLKSQDLIDINTPGMTVTEEGMELLEKLKDFMYDIKGLDDIEDYLKKSLNLQDVLIVPGDLEDEPIIINELGKTAAKYVKDKLKEDFIISLTGGSTVKAVIDNIPKMSKFKNITVLPARGGMGRNLETQSNTLAAKLAEKIGGNYKLLHVPDDLSDHALETMLNEKNIKEIVDKIYKTNILIFGIGKADEMAVKRGMSEKEVNELKEKGAVGEAFGYYFSGKGEIVRFTPTIGIRREQLENINLSIAVAGGKSKARAILSAELNLNAKVLITDEGAAREIMKILQENN